MISACVLDNAINNQHSYWHNMIILRSRVSLLGHWKPGWLRFDIVCYNSSFCWLLLLGGDSFTVTNTQCTHTHANTCM